METPNESVENATATATAKRKVAVYITMSPTGICQYNAVVGKEHIRLKTEEIMKIL